MKPTVLLCAVAIATLFSTVLGVDGSSDVLVATFADGSVEFVDLDVFEDRGGVGIDPEEEEEGDVDLRAVLGEEDLRHGNLDVDSGVNVEPEESACRTSNLPFVAALSTSTPDGILACDADAEECAVLGVTRDGIQNEWTKLPRQEHCPKSLDVSCRFLLVRAFSLCQDGIQPGSPPDGQGPYRPVDPWSAKRGEGPFVHKGKTSLVVGRWSALPTCNRRTPVPVRLSGGNLLFVPVVQRPEEGGGGLP